MIRLRDVFSKYAVATMLLTLCVGLSTAVAVEETFTVYFDSNGDVVGGGGTGHHNGTWYYYPFTDWWNQWYYNGYNATSRKTVQVTLTARVFDPQSGTSSQIEAAVNWSTESWPLDRDAPPLPGDIDSLTAENRYIERETVIPLTDVRDSVSINTSREISFCPQWVSIDIRGTNVIVEGTIVHECESEPEDPVVVEDADFGDAPEGAVAYPSTGVVGRFPTCVGTGPAAWIEHASKWL